MLDRVLDKLQLTSVPISIHKNQMIDLIGSACTCTEFPFYHLMIVEVVLL